MPVNTFPRLRAISLDDVYPACPKHLGDPVGASALVSRFPGRCTALSPLFSQTFNFQLLTLNLLPPPLSPLAATLIDLPASVANKRLTPKLSPLAAPLTKIAGGYSSGIYKAEL